MGPDTYPSIVCAPSPNALPPPRLRHHYKFVPLLVSYPAYPAPFHRTPSRVNARPQTSSQVQKLKDENNLLSRKVKELDDRLFNIKRSGCGPSCGRSAAAAPARDADTSTSATSSWAGSQQSVSPTLKPRRGAGGAGTGEGLGSAGKTYNLRRRPKIAEAAQGAGGVSTRGRRMGLRDMTNAN